MSSKAQTSTETIIMLAVFLIVFLVIFTLNQNVFFGLGNRVSRTKAENALNEIVHTSRLLYLQGDGAFAKIYVDFPDNVQNVTIENDSIFMELTFGKDTEFLTKQLPFETVGEITHFKGLQPINIDARKRFLLIGKGIVKATPESDYINVSVGDYVNQSLDIDNLLNNSMQANLSYSASGFTIVFNRVCLNFTSRQRLYANYKVYVATGTPLGEYTGNIYVDALDKVSLETKNLTIPITVNAIP